MRRRMRKDAFLRFSFWAFVASTAWPSVDGQAMCPVVSRKVADAFLDHEDPNGPGFQEVSGLAFSPTQRHNNRPIFFAVSDGGGGQRIGIFDSRTGDRLLTLRVASEFFSNRDWESLTIGSCGMSGVDRACLYIMDAGDNEARATGGSRGRDSYHILKLREPRLGEYNDNDRIPTSRMSRLTFRYDHSSSPTNHADCEAMFLDHKGWGADEDVGDIYFATKWDQENQFRYNRLFHIPASAWSPRLEGDIRYYSPRTIGRYDFGQYENNGGIHIMKRTWTNAEMTLDGTLIGLGSEVHTFVFLRCPGTSVLDAMANPDNRSRSCNDWSHPIAGQIETFAWSPDNQRTLAIPEANNPRLGWTELTYDAGQSPKVCTNRLTPPPTRPPTRPPTGLPTRPPTRPPTRRPTPQPTRLPTGRPTPRPTTPQPTPPPTREPTRPPTRNPTPGPTPPPTREPTEPPTRNPTPGPTPPPTPEPTKPPTRYPTPGPTQPPTPGPTRPPTAEPTMLPTMSGMPSMMPSVTTSSQPTTAEPTVEPSSIPSNAPTTASPSQLPSIMPSGAPSTPLPTITASTSPSGSPTTPKPTMSPTSGIFIPTDKPSSVPTTKPSSGPSSMPTDAPSSGPSRAIFGRPSIATPFPSLTPTQTLSLLPTNEPSVFPTRGLDETSTIEIATEQPTATTTVKISTNDDRDGSEHEEKEQCFGICPTGIRLINAGTIVNILDEEISCAAIEKVYRDQSGTNTVCSALAIRARRAGCLCGQVQLEPDLGASNDLAEAGYTAILAAVAAFLLIIFVGVRICLYKYRTEGVCENIEGQVKRSSLGDDKLSGMAGIREPKRIEKSKGRGKLYTQSWALWVQQFERDGGATVAETLDETAAEGKPNGG